MSEDDERKGLDEVQKITDQHIKLIDDLQKKKDAELLGQVGTGIRARDSGSGIEPMEVEASASTNPCHSSPPGVLRAVRRGPVRSAPVPSPLLVRHAAARPLRPRGAPEAGRARSLARPRADHVAVPRDDAAVRRRGARDARRGLHAARPRQAARAARSACRSLYIKDESLNPTNSFKARGLSAAVTRARDLGATTLSVPSAGNAANAMAAYAACAGPRGEGLHAAGREGAVHPRVRALRRGRHAGRRPDHRRRAAWRPSAASRSAGTTSRR